MKFKRDYKITVSADIHDNVLWSATHKGESRTMTVEDYETIAAMLEEARQRILTNINE